MGFAILVVGVVLIVAGALAAFALRRRATVSEPGPIARRLAESELDATDRDAGSGARHAQER